MRLARVRARTVGVVGVAAVLLALGSTAAWSAWSASQAVSNVSVATGDFGVAAAWSPSVDLAGMYPGEQRSGVMTLSRSGQGRWVYTIGTPAVGATLASVLTVAVYPTGACTGTPLTLPWTQSTVQAVTATPQHCVTVTLSGSAPSTLHDQSALVTIPVTAQNRSTN
jgi:hypothetical protein